MKRIILGLVLLSFALNSQWAVAQPDNQNNYDAILAKYLPADGPGAAVIISKKGKVIYQGARGLANIEHNVPLTTESVFRLGSITKQFTAAAIMMLQEQKKLNVKDNIHQYLPNFPTEGNEVTIENLLNHTSGIANYTEDRELFQKEIQVPVTLDEMLIRFSKHPMALKTGEAMRYSNTGYVLLGKIIEIASGQSYTEFIEQNIFKKLGMKSSRYGGFQIIPNRASGYEMSEQGVANTSHIDMTWPHAAGSLLSTVGDLNIWFNALTSGKLISKSSYQQMVTPFKLNDGSISNYGFGLGMSQFNKYESITHSGGIHGFVTYAFYLPSEDLYLAVLTNLSSGNPALVGNLIAADVLDIALPVFEAIKLNKAKAKKLMGQYKLESGGVRRLFMEKGKVYTKRDEGRQFEVIPMLNNSFYYEDSLAYFVIKTNEKGEQVMHFHGNFSTESQKAIKQ